MHKHNLLKALIVTALGISSSLADTITLKTGKTLTGKVLEERATEYLLEIYVTKTIKDQRVVAKSDVASIEVEAPDKKPFEALQGILPSGDQLKESDYTLIIESQLKPFISQFPKSKHLAEVENILATLESEKKRVVAGDIKLSGEWIPASEWNSNAYDLDALLILNEMRAAAEKKDYRKVMLRYDELESGFPQSDPQRESRILAAEILPIYQRIVTAKAEAADEKNKARTAAIKNLAPRDRKRSQAAHDEQDERYQKIVSDARASKTRWIPTYDYDERTLKTIERTIKSEIRKLERPAREKDNLGELYRELWALAGTGDEDSIKRGLSKFRSSKINPKYAELIHQHLIANPAPEEVIEEVIEEEIPEPVIDEKPKKKERKIISEPTDDLAEEPEKTSGMMGIVYVILGIAVLGILLGVLLKGRKSKTDEA